MTETEQHECETDCGRPAPTTYICWECINHAHRELERITPEDAATLLLIARRQATSGEMKARSNGGGSGAGQDALNLGVYTLWANLTGNYADHLDSLPHQPDAAHHYHRVLEDVERGLIVARGEARPSPEQVKHEMEKIIPMTSEDVCAWLGDKLGLRIHPRRIRVWKHRGIITPDKTSESRGVRYHPATVLRSLAKVQ